MILPILLVFLLADIDECTEGTDGCVHSCSNVAGSYTCSCNSGYRLASDNHGCEGMKVHFNSLVMSVINLNQISMNAWMMTSTSANKYATTLMDHTAAFVLKVMNSIVTDSHAEVRNNNCCIMTSFLLY